MASAQELAFDVLSCDTPAALSELLRLWPQTLASAAARVFGGCASGSTEAAAQPFPAGGKRWHPVRLVPFRALALPFLDRHRSVFCLGPGILYFGLVRDGPLRGFASSWKVWRPGAWGPGESFKGFESVVRLFFVGSLVCVRRPCSRSKDLPPWLLRSPLAEEVGS